MKDIFKRVPLPICGVALGLAALGNLLQSYSEGVRTVCGILSGLCLLLYIIKVILFPASFKEDMGNPIMASVFGTFSMALMLLAGYLKPLLGSAAMVLWYIAIAIHVALIVYFTIQFILKLQLPKVFASYFIVYVGIAVAAVSAPAFGQEAVGAVTFWFGLATFIALLALVTYRYVKVKEVPKPALPLICIYAAPASLCVAGYVQSVTPKSFGLLIALYAVACILYVFALVKAVGFLKLPFFPSYAAFTFPFVISAIASKQTMACAAKLGSPLPFLQYVVLVETIIATVLVLYALVRFLMHIFAKPQPAKK